MRIFNFKHFLILPWLLCGCAVAHVAQPQWQAGMAYTIITPPVGFRMAGYFDERLSTGVHDPLEAKAIVLRQGETEAALVFCDLVGLSLDVTRQARADASRETGIPVENIVVAATHSHTGPLFDDVRRDQFHREAMEQYGHDPQETIDYPAFLRQRIVEAIVQARRNLRPVEIDAGIARQPGLPFNRRYYMKNGKVVFNPGHLNPKIVAPAGPVDSDVDVLLFRDFIGVPQINHAIVQNNQRAMGSLTVFAMHCDTVSGTLFSADYPYYIQETLRSAFGDHFISVFGAGTSGDLNHIDVRRRVSHDEGFDVAESIGRRIGATILAAVPKFKPIASPSLAVEDTVLSLPLQTVTPEELEKAKIILGKLRDPKVNFYDKVRAVKAVDLEQRGTNYPAEIQVFRLGANTAIVCLPAEIFVQFGLEIKKASPFKNTFVISICNDRPSYVPTLKAFKEGSYEVVNSRLKPGGGEAMTQAAIEMLRQLKRN